MLASAQSEPPVQDSETSWHIRPSEVSLYSSMQLDKKYKLVDNETSRHITSPSLKTANHTIKNDCVNTKHNHLGEIREIKD